MGYSHGKHWTEDLIKEKVLEVKNALNLDRMPTSSECAEYYGDFCLSNAITKREWWYKLANELNLPIKCCETTFGKKYEYFIKEILESKGFKVEKMPQNHPYDLLVNGTVKIDVKASHLYKGKSGNFYSFNLEKRFATCDFFILIEINQKEEVERTMVVPSAVVLKNNQISVGETNSKYHSFTDRYDYITLLSEWWEKTK